MESIPHSGASAKGDAGLPSTAEKVRFLSAPGAYLHAPASVEVLETHMSYVFLAGDRVYKLKKPVRSPFLDFSTIDAREHNCREEVRLSVAPLTYRPQRGMALGGDGAVIDWLVEMRRLPREAMLDRLIAEDRVSAAQIDALSDTLAAFYRGVEHAAIGAEDYALRFFREQEKNRDVLTRRDFALDHGRTPVLLDLLDARLAASRSQLQARVLQGQIVDGHGDLRPEHICFRDPIAIFDCLEFNADLRQVDPFDELAYLGVECTLLGAKTLGAELVDKVAQRLSCKPPRRLISLYAAWRAVLRARQSVAHLLDNSPREPTKWEPLATRYLNLAQSALGADNPTGR